jgi:hypothetical protein
MKMYSAICGAVGGNAVLTLISVMEGLLINAAFCAAGTAVGVWVARKELAQLNGGRTQ